jgi:hypothetical protein
MTPEDRDEAIKDWCNAVEAACVKLRMNLGDTVKPAVNHADQVGTSPTIAINEVNFTQLKWNQAHSAQMGDYENAYLTENDQGKFTQVFNILKAENASIKARYHGKTYAYSYWLFELEGKIYRQKLKESQ